MIQQECKLKVSDNSGAKRVKCIKVLGGSRRRYARVGDVIVCSIQETEPNGKVKKGTVCKAVIVRTKNPIHRKDGQHLRFDENCCVLINAKNEPEGTRVFGSCPVEVRKRGFSKIASLAPEVI